MSNQNPEQLQRRLIWTERQLKSANTHTEEAFTKLQAAVKELDVMRRQLQKAQVDLGKTRIERDEARFWARKYREKTLP